jgi:two-component system, OmpR family, alkaline phosphatase synthesis response regulator PhoP
LEERLKAEKILVIEDDEETAEFIKETLNLEGYEPIIALYGEEGLRKLDEENPSLILLDLNLPDIDGLDICKRIKENVDTRQIPIIVLTARVTTDDKVTGLDAGADDYLVKPFSPRELLARIKAIFRRIEYYAPQTDEIISKGGVTLEVGTHHVVVTIYEEVDLAPKEFQLLYLLMKNSGKVLQRGYLLKTLWGYSQDRDTRTVDVHIQRLRKKLGDTAGKRIETIEGYGYKFID